MLVQVTIMFHLVNAVVSVWPLSCPQPLTILLQLSNGNESVLVSMLVWLLQKRQK